jgi:hypothetical protein
MQKSLTFSILFSSLLAISLSAQVAFKVAGPDLMTKQVLVSAYELPFPATHIPECIPPGNVRVTNIGADNFEVEWDGPKAPDGGISYMVRYKPISKRDWTEVRVDQGRSFQLEGLDNRLVYEVGVKKICPPVKNEPELSSEWVLVGDISLPSYRTISLPAFICGDPYTLPTCQGVAEARSFDTLYAAGIPILVDSIWTEFVFGQKDWFGNGWAPLPFGNLVVRVEWGGEPGNLITIDSNGVLCSGRIRGVSDDPAYHPDLDPGPIPFGGEICLPTNIGNGLPWDENGFGPDSAYIKQPPYDGYEPGDPIDSTGQYDPWGFDANGIHKDTQTEFNPYGCTQEQLNNQPQEPPCDSLPPPYYWINEGDNPPTQEGLALAHEVSDSLALWVAQILENLEQAYQDSSDVQSTGCNLIRDSINFYVNALDYERKFLFGEGDSLQEDYFRVGMSERFSSKPELFAFGITRNPDQVKLEKKHADLYHCDKKFLVFQHVLEILDDFQGSRFDGIVNDLMEKIKGFPAAAAEKYSNRDSLFVWLTNELKIKTNLEYHALYGFSGIQPESDRGLWASYFKEPESQGSFLAASFPDGELNQAFLQSLQVTPEDISFQFRQGWRMINGVHRAYYLEAIDRERNRTALFNPALLTAHDSTLMPLILGNRAADGRLYKVYLDDIVFYPEYATLDAYILLELPNNGQKIVFEAHDIEFGPTGPVLFPLKLQLGNDIDVRLSNAAKLIIKGSEDTFVSVDCQGFGGIGIEAEVEICRNYLIPVDPVSGEILPEPYRVHGYIQNFFPTWNDFYIEISMDPFVVKGVDDIQWHINRVVVDFSDKVSPGSPAAPPPGYFSPFAGPGGFSPHWKGFYTGNFSATLPRQFSDGDPVAVGVQDVVIDDMGFSGQVYLANVLPLNEGNAGGWAFSIDTIDVTIIGNQLQDAGLSGLVHVPVISNANDCNTGPATAGDCLRYSAFIEPGNIYHFAVFMPAEEYCIDMWKGTSVKLYGNTSIQMKLENGEFDMLATLYGKVSVSSDTAGPVGFQIGEIVFEKVQISNEEPYFSPGLWKFPQTLGVNLGGFGLALSNIKMDKTEEGDPSLCFYAELSIVNDAIPLTAGAGFKIVGQKVEWNGRHRWKFKNVQINKIYLDGSFSGVDKITGVLEFFEQDAVYGTGFRGGVGVAFQGLNSVTALAHFGKKDTYKYFFVDALVCATIPIVPGLDLTGFGGGVYYHMDRPQSSYSLPVCTGPPVIPVQLGTSLSGINYVPDSTKLIGLKATIAVAVGKETALNANATFEILFKETQNSLGFGVDRLDFYGNARLLAAADRQASPAAAAEGSPPQNGAALCANLYWTMDFSNRTFSGEMETFLNTPGNFIRGSGTNGRLSKTEIYFGPDKWYFRMGRTPMSERNGMVIQIPGSKNPTVDIGTYFQVGSGGIDPMPEIPEDIRNLFGEGAFPSVNNRNAFVHSGAGFILGARADFSLLDMHVQVCNFNLLTAKLKAMLGYDISVLDWGESAVCAGTQEPVGINGWYAQGQIYAGLTGELLVANAELATASLGAVLEARFPNPFWARGMLHAQVNTFWGKADLDFTFELGEKCEITGVDNPVAEIPLILSIIPGNGMTEVSVESNPRITFVMPVGARFGIPELGSGKPYTPVLDYAKLYYKGIEIPVEKSWSENLLELTLAPGFFLPANDTIALDVLAHIDSSGVEIHSEHRIDTFFTGGPVARIYEDNVAGSYPFDGQYNFYKKQLVNKVGYIQLEKGQPSLFYDMEGYGDLVVRWRKAGNQVFFKDKAFYKAIENKILFLIPEWLMDNEELYFIDFVRIPTPDPNFGNGYGGANNETEVSLSQDIFDGGEDGGNNFPIPVPGNAGGGGASSPPPAAQEGYAAATAKSGGETLNSGAPLPVIVLYSIHFRTSQYNTFNEKVAAWMAGKQITSAQYENFRNAAELEPFDKFELKGYKGSGPLVTITADLTNSWYKNQVLPDVYEFYLENGEWILKLNRQVAPLGLPPVNGVEISNDPQTPDLWISPAMARLGELPPEFSGERDVQVAYKLGKYFEADFNDFHKDARNYAIERLNLVPEAAVCLEEGHSFCDCLQIVSVPEYIELLACDQIQFPIPPAGKYKIFWKYRLPGQEGVHSIMEAEVER